MREFLNSRLKLAICQLQRPIRMLMRPANPTRSFQSSGTDLYISLAQPLQLKRFVLNRFAFIDETIRSFYKSREGNALKGPLVLWNTIDVNRAAANMQREPIFKLVITAIRS